MREKTVKKLLDIVKNNYNDIAQDFDISRKKYLWPEMERFSKLIFSGASVLDAGCGNGRLIEAFKDKQVKYTGFDSNINLINLAKKNYPDNIFFVHDILNKIDGTEKYDFIFSIAVILHIPSQKLRVEVLKNLASKLKSDGRLIISVWDFYNQDKFYSLIKKSEIKRMLSFDGREKGDLLFFWTSGDGKYKSKRYYHAFKEKELIEMVKLANLKIEDLYYSGKNIWLTLKNKE